MIPVPSGAGEKRLEQHCIRGVYLADLFGTSSSRIRGRAECGGVDVYQPVLDPIEHPKPVMEPTLFEAVPFVPLVGSSPQLFWERRSFLAPQ